MGESLFTVSDELNSDDEWIEEAGILAGLGTACEILALGCSDVDRNCHDSRTISTAYSTATTRTKRTSYRCVLRFITKSKTRSVRG